MINVKLRTAMNLKKIIGKSEVEISVPKGCVVKEFIEEIVKIYGEDLANNLFDTNNSSLLSHIRLMVNGQDIGFLNGMGTVLHDGDEILILPPACGG